MARLPTRNTPRWRASPIASACRRRSSIRRSSALQRRWTDASRSCVRSALARDEPLELALVLRPVGVILDGLVLDDLVALEQLRELADLPAAVAVVGPAVDHDETALLEARLDLLDPFDLARRVDHRDEVPAVL